MNKPSGKGTSFKVIFAYLALTPTFALLFVFSLYPAIKAFINSFYYMNFNNMRNTRFVGLDNYQTLLGDATFWKSFYNLGLFIAFGFISTFFVLMPVTYLVFRLGEGRWGKWIQRLYIIPMVIPFTVLILFWKFFYEYNFGILNNALKSLGLDAYMHVWLGEQATALPAILFVGFPWITGFGFLILLAGFQNNDPALHEAAKIDGASGGQIFLKIDIPLVLPQIKILIVLGMIAGIQQFGTQLIMTNGGPNGATIVPGLLMYQTAFTNGNIGYGSTIGVFLFAITLVITFINNKFIRSRE
ncbi:carbohydrate ABC transporter permease [Cohnella sp. GCM10020058]|uniref:carbohydrate ABC transporter permease n=1 Tax=Cohnella sp. GCM10020058 TaxID=3317330 RepID=UPI0036318781